MFEEEGPHLQHLPLMGMQYFTEAQRTVCDDSCVRVDHSSYAARPAPIGSRVLVRVFEHRIEIRDLPTAPRRLVWNATITMVGRSRGRWACGQGAKRLVHMSTGRY